jgi:hypothetical protein
MNMMNDQAELADEGRPSSLAVGETYWGYIVREHASDQDRRFLRDAVLVFSGAVLVLVGLGQWLMPGALFTADLVALKIAVTAAMLSLGLVCLHAVGRDAAVEIQVDTVKRELRVVERDRRGGERLVQRIAMRDIDSAYVKRGPHPSAGGHLLLRVAHSEAPLHLASGSERELRLLHDRVRRDLRPPRERIERRLLREAARAMPGRPGDSAARV